MTIPGLREFVPWWKHGDEGCILINVTLLKEGSQAKHVPWEERACESFIPLWMDIYHREVAIISGLLPELFVVQLSHKDGGFL